MSIMKPIDVSLDDIARGPSSMNFGEGQPSERNMDRLDFLLENQEDESSKRLEEIKETHHDMDTIGKEERDSPKGTNHGEQPDQEEEEKKEDSFEDIDF